MSFSSQSPQALLSTAVVALANSSIISNLTTTAVSPTTFSTSVITATVIPTPSALGFQLKVSQPDSIFDGLMVNAHHTRFFLGLNASSAATFTGGDDMLNLSMNGTTGRSDLVYLGPVGGLRYTAADSPDSLRNGTIATGWQKATHGANLVSIANAAGLFQACPKPNLGAGVYQIFVETPGFRRRNCTSFTAIAVDTSDM